MVVVVMVLVSLVVTLAIAILLVALAGSRGDCGAALSRQLA